jgi:iron complex outermembrane receptor protein
MMDERANRVASAYTSFKENKLYFNYTSHVMDNDLRESKMLMVTGAQNLTIGMVGKFYEVVYRNWDADNRFTMPNEQIDNQLIPNVSSYHASLHKVFNFGQFDLSAKVGATYLKVGESERKTFYEAIYNDVKDSRIFPTFGVSLSYTEALSSKFGFGVLAEAASEAPETEALFIAVQKPMDSPNWSGNPNLSQPVRSTIRASFNYSNLRLELFGSRIWNYTDLATAATAMKKYQTYANINALMAGVNFEAAWEYFEVEASYTWAENSSSKSALSEIPPLKISSKINSPNLAGVNGFIRHTYSNAQLRIDEELKETTTSAWNRLDAGLYYKLSGVLFALEIENIFNINYSQHLSFLRNPYSAGIKVNEPGRTFRFRLTWSGIFSD